MCSESWGCWGFHQGWDMTRVSFGKVTVSIATTVPGPGTCIMPGFLACARGLGGGADRDWRGAGVGLREGPHVLQQEPDLFSRQKQRRPRTGKACHTGAPWAKQSSGRSRGRGESSGLGDTGTGLRCPWDLTVVVSEGRGVGCVVASIVAGRLRVSWGFPQVTATALSSKGRPWPGVEDRGGRACSGGAAFQFCKMEKFESSVAQNGNALSAELYS